MAIKAEFQIDNTWASFDVEQHVDGLFIAKANAPIGGIPPYFLPPIVYMYRTPTGWKGDHHRKDLVHAIGLQIDVAMK